MTYSPDVNEYLTDPTKREDPYPMLAELRASSGGIAKTAIGPSLVLSYDAAKKTMISKKVSRWQAALNELEPDKAPTPEIRHALEASRQMLINRDGADHARLRTLIMSAFTPKALAEWQRRIDKIVVRLVDQVVEKEEFDFRNEVAFPLPELVACEMLGVPYEDHAKWSKWSEESVAANRAAGATGENLRVAQEAYYNLYLYFLDLVEKRMAEPQDDLLSMLIAARDEGDKLNTDELVGTAILVIQAGHETTANLINNLMHHLVHHPEDMRKLRENPAKIPNAVQEAVRMLSPAHFGLPRLTTGEVELAGKLLPAGEPLMVVWGAANRDPKIFDDPDTFDMDRPNLGRQVGFAFGVHVCIGRPLAEMEAERMFQEIIARLPDYELVSEPKVAPSFTRGYRSLPLRRKQTVAPSADNPTKAYEPVR